MFRRLRSPSALRLLVLLAVLGAGAAAGVLAYLALTGAAEDLQSVRDRLEEAVDLADAGDIAAAADAFAEAERSASRAVEQVHSPAVRLVGFLPKLDVTVDSVIASTEAAHLIAEAGQQLMDAVTDVPGGFDALTLGSGGDSGWLDAAADLSAPLGDAEARLQLAHTLVTEAPAETSFAQVDASRARIEEELEGVVPAVGDLTALIDVLPEIFGADTPRRYFLGAQNPAEVRGTGGLIGAYSILTASAGAVEIEPFRPVQELPANIFSEDLAPSEEFFERYSPELVANGTWLNINFSPDFPSVAETIEAMYRDATGVRLDGTIVVDPFALEAMLDATGPVTVPDPDVGTVDAETIVTFITTEAPLALGFGGERKEILGDAARAVLDEFLSGAVPGRRRIEALGATVRGGHLLMHSASPEVQAALDRIGLTGALPDPEQAVLDVSLNNTAESKADVWLTQQLDWNLNLDPDGTASGALYTTMTNNAPSDPGIPRYIMGPGERNSSLLSFGESRPLLTVACGTCALVASSYPDHDEFGTRGGQEQGHTLSSVRPRIPIGSTVEIDQRFDLPHAWRRAGQSGLLELAIDTPTLVQPVAISVSVLAPPGWVWDPPADDLAIIEGGRLLLELVDPDATFGPYTLSSTTQP